MRTTSFSLLILLAGSAFASPIPFNVSILSSPIACTQGINRAQVLTDAASDATYHWTIANGVIVEGANTSSVKFTPVDGGFSVLTVSVEWLGTQKTQHTALPIFDPPTILRQPQSMTVLPGSSVTLSVASDDEIAVYDWFEGPTGNTSKIVSAGAIAFKTPALAKSASYWVRVTGRCGVVASQTATITLLGKRRSTGR
jgi:hypothetical protein